MIRSRLGDRCPCPSRYTMAALAADQKRLAYFAEKRASQILFTAEEDAEEVHRRARFDAYAYRPERTAKNHLARLREVERRSKVRPMTLQERYNLRLLSLLYSTGQPRTAPKAELDNADYHPLRDEPVAEDGNLYPPNSRLRPPPGDPNKDPSEEKPAGIVAFPDRGITLRH